MPLPIRPLAFALALLSFAAAAPASAQTDTVVGRWDVVEEAPPRGPGIVALVFEAGGAMLVTYSPEVRVEDPGAPTRARYTIEGDTITAFIGGEPAPATFWFQKGDLYIRDESGTVLHLQRKSGG